MRLKKRIEKTAYDDYSDDYLTSFDRTDDNFHDYTMGEAGPYSGYDDQKIGWQEDPSGDYRWQDTPKDDDDWQKWDEDSYSGFYGGETRKENSNLKILLLGLLAAAVAVAAIVAVPKLIRNKGIVVPAEDPYVVDQTLLYYRALLNDEEKQLYDYLCSEIIKQPDTITGIHARSCDQLAKVFQYIQADHPDFFWVSGGYNYTYLTTENGVDVDLTLSYEMDIQQRRQMQERIDGVVDYVQLCLGNLSEYEKVKGVYEYLINNSVYDLNNGGQTICPILVEGRGVCTSYAKSTQYLLQKLGVQALVVSGTVGGDGHAWNIVRIDGDYYQVDTTWGDPVSDDGSQTLTYTYFCLTSREMYSDHTPSGDLPVPDCTATACNYFRKEGRMANAYDESWLLNLMRQDTTLQQNIVFRTSDANVYYQYCDQLFNKNGIFRLLEQLNVTNVDQYNVSHNTDDQFFVITIYPNYL